MEDPLQGIFKIMQDEGAKRNPPSICCGEVVTSWPDITIKIGELLLTKNQLKVSEHLTKYFVKVELKGTLTSGTQSSSVSNDAVVEGEMTCTSTLIAGDEVAMIASQDGNTYFVLCKVV